jgi:hypothetical protein
MNTPQIYKKGRKIILYVSDIDGFEMKKIESEKKMEKMETGKIYMAEWQAEKKTENVIRINVMGIFFI